MRNALKTLTLCTLILSGFNASEAAAPKDKKELIAEVRAVFSKVRSFYAPYFNQSCLWDDIPWLRCKLHPYLCEDYSDMKKKFTLNEYYSYENDAKIVMNKRAGKIIKEIDEDKGDFNKLAFRISIDLNAEAQTLKQAADLLNAKIGPLKKMYKDITGKSCTK